MNDDEVTRLMEVPLEVSQKFFRDNEVRRNDKEGHWGGDLAQTPCVGVASMGNTHFGETRFSPEPEPAPHDRRDERSSTLPAVRQHGVRKTTAKVLRVLEASRSLSLFLGLCVGVGAALLVLLVGRPERHAPTAVASPPVSLRVMVREAGAPQRGSGRGIASVAVRAGNQVVVTDEDGTADFLDVMEDGGLLVEASCPEGYVGGRLSRILTPAVLRSSPRWSLELGCEPEFVQVEVIVKAEGCGEMNVLIDGIAVGVTQRGEYRTSSRTFGEAAIELRVEPVSGVCQLDQVRTVALTRAEPVVEVKFEGARPKSRRIQRNVPASAPRPYRL